MKAAAGRTTKATPRWLGAILLAFALLVGGAQAIGPTPALARVDLPDATYTVEVALEGGTGRASVASPAELVVSGGEAAATIVWSSPNYDQMVVDGVAYLPINEGGNSVFVVPVATLDEPLAVSAETTAMSEPHMIDYRLVFDPSTVEKAKAAGLFEGGAGNVAATVAVLAVAVLAIAWMQRRGGSRA